MAISQFCVDLEEGEIAAGEEETVFTNQRHKARAEVLCRSVLVDGSLMQTRNVFSYSDSSCCYYSSNIAPFQNLTT